MSQARARLSMCLSSCAGKRGACDCIAVPLGQADAARDSGQTPWAMWRRGIKLDWGVGGFGGIWGGRGR